MEGWMCFEDEVASNLESIHAALKCTDRVDLRDEDNAAHGLQTLGTAFAHLAVATNDSLKKQVFL